VVPEREWSLAAWQWAEHKVYERCTTFSAPQRKSPAEAGLTLLLMIGTVWSYRPNLISYGLRNEIRRCDSRCCNAI